MALIDDGNIITLKGEEPGNKDYKIYCDKVGDAESLLQENNPLQNRITADTGRRLWEKFYRDHVQRYESHFGSPDECYKHLLSRENIGDIAKMTDIGRRLSRKG